MKQILMIMIGLCFMIVFGTVGMLIFIAPLWLAKNLQSNWWLLLYIPLFSVMIYFLEDD